jgi:signal transduction histidine kinase
MKLALKIVAICLVAMILITALSSYLIAKREFDLVRDRQQNDAERMAQLIRESVNVAYRSEGHEGIVKAIRTQSVETGTLRYRWVWFDVSLNEPSRPAVSMNDLGKILSGQMGSVVSNHGGENQMHTYYPIDVVSDDGTTRKGAIEVSDPLDVAELKAWETVKTAVTAVAIMTLVCFVVVAWAGIRMIGRPLSRLVKQTELIGEGVYDSPIQLKSRDEFAELGAALNKMSAKIVEQQDRIQSESAARVATQEQLRHADRLKTVGRLAAGIAHEIGTPLNVVSGRAGLIRSGKLSASELTESAAAIQQESNRIASIVRQLLDFARPSAPQRRLFDLQPVVAETLKLLQTMANKAQIQVELLADRNAGCEVYADESQIRQVITNLLVNAIQATDEGGRIQVSIANADAGMDSTCSTPMVCVSVADNGCGMDEDTREHVFEPFFTTKDVGSGTGLGLSISHGIIEEHGGRIEVESQPGEGSTFRVYLPKKQASHENSPA